MLAILLFMFAPLAAERPRFPQQSLYIVNVDLIILNRVRSYQRSFDRWGRPSYKPSPTWWVSYWQRPGFPMLGGYWPENKRLWIDRGWNSATNLSTIWHGTSGWCFEFKNGIGVIAPEIHVIDSDFDVEMRWRKTYKSIRKPLF